jgi:hypothetical protein
MPDGIDRLADVVSEIPIKVIEWFFSLNLEQHKILLRIAGLAVVVIVFVLWYLSPSK